jgi:hypothetical protein
MAEAAALEESAESIEQLSIAEREQSGGSDPSVTALEEEQYVQVGGWVVGGAGAVPLP